MIQKPGFSLSRRSFLKAGGASILAAPVIIPSTVLGQASPGNKLTLGCIGVGSQGQGNMGGFLGQDDVRIVSVCDVDATKAEEAKRKVDAHYGNSDCKIYRDYRDVAARNDIDVVSIATPDHWHALTAIACAKAGKDIYCEKPVSHNLQEGRAMATAVTRHGCIWQTGSWQRSGSDFQAACELVRNGAIGEVRHIEVCLPDGGDGRFVTDRPQPPKSLDYDFYVGPAKWVPYHPDRLHWNWRWWLGFGGGQLMDWIGHHADIAHMGMDYDHTGPIKIEPDVWRVNAASNLYDAPTDYRFTLTYATGVTMTICSGRHRSAAFSKFGGGGTMWVGDDDQAVWVDRGGMRTNPENLAQMTFGGDAFRFKPTRGHVRDFLDCVKSRERPIAHIEAAHRAASLGHLGMIACRLGRTLAWNPESEHFVGDAQAESMLGQACRGEWAS
jgi:predicted dehydrogenase